jgi:hypothetical protein
MFLISKTGKKKKKTFDTYVNYKFQDIWALKMPWADLFSMKLDWSLLWNVTFVPNWEEEQGFGG